LLVFFLVTGIIIAPSLLFSTLHPQKNRSKCSALHSVLNQVHNEGCLYSDQHTVTVTVNMNKQPDDISSDKSTDGNFWILCCQIIRKDSVSTAAAGQRWW